MDQSDYQHQTRSEAEELPTSPVGSPTPKPKSDFPNAAPRAHVPFVVPVQIAGYRIVRLIGAGGMGLVYEAEHEVLQRRVALKLMQPGAVSSEAIARFESEARALARLKHPGIAQVFDTGIYRPGGDDSSIVPYLSMELVEGSFTLHEFAERPGVTMETKLRVVADVCDALEHAHGAGVVHRDLKPSNILVNPGGVTGSANDPSIKIIDFGIAKVLGDGSRTITSRGQIVGTPSYMAPEQLGGGTVDDRTDIYALGVILYQLCTGRLPLDVPRDLDRRGLERVLNEAAPMPPRTLDRRLEGELETIILKCLQKGASERYQNVGELRADLLAFLSGEPIRATRIGKIVQARRTIGRFGAKRPMTAFVLCAAASVLFSMLVVFPALNFWSDLSLRYASAAGWFAPASGMLSSLPDVRVIAIDNETDLEAIAAAEGLKGVSRDNIRSARLIHARLLKRLAMVDPRAVGLDIMFRRPTEFDGPLAASIAELRARGIGVVLASPVWAFEPDGLPPIVPDFAKLAWAGPPTGGFSGPETWAMDLALERELTEVIAGFSTLVFAACREPEAEVALSLQNGVAEIRYFKAGTQRRAVLRSPDRLKYSGVQHITTPDPERGLLPGDTLAVSVIPISVAPLSACTIPLQRFFEMSEQDLRREFSGRLVLIGNSSDAGGDIQESPSGLLVPGVWTHAATVQQLLRDEVVDSPDLSVLWWVAGMMAVAGAWAAFGFSRVWRAVVFLIALTGIALCVSVLLLRTGGMYWNPLSAIAAGWLACGLALVVTHDVRRVRAARIGST